MSAFFAYLARLRLVQRWGLMRAAEPENVAEHSHQVAVVAHALTVIGVRFHNRTLDPNTVAVVALFHDASEVFTGDLPTPVKYATTEMRTAYKELETAATQRLLSMLPKGLQREYAPLLTPTDPEVIQARQGCRQALWPSEGCAGNQSRKPRVHASRSCP